MGGGSSQPKNTSQTTTVQPPSWAVPYFTNYLNRSQQLANQPYTPYTGQLVAGTTGDQNYAEYLANLGASGGLNGQKQVLESLSSLIGGSYNIDPGSNQYLGATTNVGTNQYAGSNPYLGQLIDASNSDVTRQYNNNSVPQLAAQFAQGGAFGGSAMQSAASDSQRQLAEVLANNSNSLRFQDYNQQANLAESALNRSVQAQQTDLARNAGIAQQDIANRLQANQQNAGNILAAAQGLTGANALQSQFLGQYGNLSGLQQQANQSNLDAAYNQWYQQNYGYPQQQLNTLGQGLNALSGNFQSSASSGTNPAYVGRSTGGALTSGLGGAATGFALGGPVGAAIGGGVGLLGYYL